jgi:hypothetical protein
MRERSGSFSKAENDPTPDGHPFIPSVIQPTRFWNELSKQLPVRHVEGTALLCLRLDGGKVYETTQAMLSAPPLRGSLRTH